MILHGGRYLFNAIKPSTGAIKNKRAVLIIKAQAHLLFV